MAATRAGGSGVRLLARPTPAHPNTAGCRRLRCGRGLRNEGRLRSRLILRLAAEAGLRRAEVARVNSRDVVDGPSLRVRGKGGHVRVVPLSDSLAAEIVGRRGYCFPSQRGDHLTAKAVGVLASDLLGPVALHSLRHRFATRAYRGSRNILAVQQLLGHANLSITQRYVDCDDAERRAAVMCVLAA